MGISDFFNFGHGNDRRDIVYILVWLVHYVMWASGLTPPDGRRPCRKNVQT